MLNCGVSCQSSLNSLLCCHIRWNMDYMVSIGNGFASITRDFGLYIKLDSL